jgi:hypothetical protein
MAKFESVNPVVRNLQSKPVGNAAKKAVKAYRNNRQNARGRGWTTV